MNSYGHYVILQEFHGHCVILQELHYQCVILQEFKRVFQICLNAHDGMDNIMHVGQDVWCVSWKEVGIHVQSRMQHASCTLISVLIIT